METFWKLFERSTVTSFFLTIGVVGAAIYCWVTGTELPDALQAATMLILGYFFGVKGQVAINNRKVATAAR